jgi:hypothetical protein
MVKSLKGSSQLKIYMILPGGVGYMTGSETGTVRSVTLIDNKTYRSFSAATIRLSGSSS